MGKLDSKKERLDRYIAKAKLLGVNTLEFKYIDSDIILVGSNVISRYLEIPDFVDIISEGAFSNNDYIEHVVIPDSVLYLGRFAFNGCTNLSKVEIRGNRLRTILAGAFSNCARLLYIAVPDSVNEIGDVAFSDCVKLRNIKLPNELISIGDRVFSGCEKLKSIKLPNKLTSLGRETFSGSGIESIEIPDGIIEISTELCAYCTNLTTVKLGKNTKRIGINAFEGCTQLRHITIPETVESIGDYAFKYAILGRIKIPTNCILGKQSFDSFGTTVIRENKDSIWK